MGNTEYKGFDVAARMSQRLLCVAGMLGEGAGDGCSFNRTADVGCDHGYVSIYLDHAGIVVALIDVAVEGWLAKQVFQF